MPGNHSSVKLKWYPPKQPNGMIVTYTIRTTHLNVENAYRGQDLCVYHTKHQNLSSEYIIKNLENGNYSFEVMATSLAGMGKWSSRVYVLIDVSPVHLFILEKYIQ